jgi:hypothetical protein
MNKLQNITDKRSIYLIEAVRISYSISEHSYENLYQALHKFNDNEQKFDLSIYLNAWSLIDSLHRFGDCIKNIRGFSHKDERYKRFSGHLSEINIFRNYMQHLSAPKTSSKLISDDTYPVMGALAWSLDGSISRTIAYGTLPVGATFNTLGYDTEIGKYVTDIKIGCLDKELSLMKSIELAKECHLYFEEFLALNSYISNEKLDASKIIMGTSDVKAIMEKPEVKTKERYVRISVKVSA